MQVPELDSDLLKNVPNLTEHDDIGSGMCREQEYSLPAIYYICVRNLS